MKRLVSVPPNYFYACILICIPFYFLLSKFRYILFPYNITGILLIPVGIYLVLNPWYLFREYNTPEDFSPSTALVVNGTYKFSRNPMYLGGVLILAGIACTTGNVCAFISPVLFFLIMHYMFIPYEEEKMESTFGEEYLKYKKVVRRWI